MPAGRPTDYTAELAAKICADISIGKRIAVICEADDMPATSSVYLWLTKHKEFSDQYARAKEEQMIVREEEMLNIADNTSPDQVNVARLQVDTRKWIMSKLAPKKYGDKITTEATGNMTLTVKTGVPRKGRSE